jgi:hypothetical protein
MSRCSQSHTVLLSAKPVHVQPSHSPPTTVTAKATAADYTWSMGKGYADGPAGEELLAAQERGDHLAQDFEAPPRKMGWGSTKDDPTPHVLGEVGEVDPDELFESGRAWGLYVAVEAAR